ncbi:hypothetical protein O5O45_00345 [Hahella aquimaris]|uniref:hypothetical protein n=1 Tax=Hahella sp. HNIBRBA332 TaxID=3015983 RepID=UPI00273BBDBD|nr:hypothetical protein [Hahella sp. HNIBRBA332]WLQ14383.1 hypothetical protein O5O45_00345 [Hahella sp. HNIBRBA332]
MRDIQMLGVQMNPSIFVSQLINPMEDMDLSSYSYKEVILAALTWPTDGWAPQALDWIEKGVQLDSEIVLALELFSSNKCNSQKNRHRAFALAKSWLRDNANT